jgi:hypothetical protein
MGAVTTSETSDCFYETTLHNIPEDNHLHLKQLFLPPPATDVAVTYATNGYFICAVYLKKLSVAQTVMLKQDSDELLHL